MQLGPPLIAAAYQAMPSPGAPRSTVPTWSSSVSAAMTVPSVSIHAATVPASLTTTGPVVSNVVSRVPSSATTTAMLKTSPSQRVATRLPFQTTADW